MGTLFSELGPLADESSVGPRVYADANVPAGLVTFMRVSLGWDVFFVMEHDEGYRVRAYTTARDYLDDRVFPPLETSGVLVLSAPNQRGLERLLTRADRDIFRVGAGELVALPLEGTKLQVFPEFGAGLA